MSFNWDMDLYDRMVEAHALFSKHVLENSFVKNFFKDKEIVYCELSDDKFKTKIDMDSCIDAFCYTKEPSINPFTGKEELVPITKRLAIRVRDKKWDSFTIRLVKPRTGQSTEYMKIKTALEKGGLCPDWTIQAHVIKKGFWSVGIISTPILFDYVKKNMDTLKDKVKFVKDGSAHFIPIEWEDLIDAGVNFVMINSDGITGTL